MLTSNVEAATVKVLDAIFIGRIVPLYNQDILSEYIEVLNRPKFHFPQTIVNQYLLAIQELGIEYERVHCIEDFPDEDDVVFYEVALSKEDAYLVTGNIKHFPKSPIVVTPIEMLQILLEQ